MNKTERLFATLLLLQVKKRIPPTEIAAHFEVSIRTVYRDIQALSESGVPIMSERGRGCAVMEGYFLPPLLFTPKEATILWIGTEFVRDQTDASYKKDAESAFLKIESVLPEKIRIEIQELKKKISLRYREPSFLQRETTFIEQIKEATLKRNVIRMKYHSSSRGVISERMVEPLGLIFSDGFWYLVAYCRMRKDIRSFRTDRIQNLSILEETFKQRTDFSIQNYISLDRSGQRRIRSEIPIKILFTPEAAKKAKDQIPWLIVEEERATDGNVVLTLHLEDLTWVVGWILSFGMEAKVLSPRLLKERIRQFLLKLLEHHREGKEFRVK